MTKHAEPFFSVIIPTFNRPEMLGRALTSLRWQSFKNFEVVVVNDRGDDPSPILNAFPELDITLLESKVKGPAGARNTGLAAARGEYIAYLDDDDIYYDNHLAAAAKLFVKAEVAVCYSNSLENVQVRQNDGAWLTLRRRQLFDEDFTESAFYERNITPTLCVAHSRQCLQHVSGVSTLMPAHEDWLFWQTLARFYDFAHIRLLTCEVKNRLSGTPTSLSKNISEMRDTWIRVRFLGECLKHMNSLKELYATQKTATLTALAGSRAMLTICVRVASHGDIRALERNILPHVGSMRSLALVLDGCADLAGEAERLCAPLRQESRLTMLSSEEHMGDVFAFNRLLPLIKSPLTVTVSPRVRLHDEGLRLMMETALDKTCLVGPALTGGTFFYQGGSVGEDGSLRFCKTGSAPDTACSMDVLPMECLMGPTAVFRQLGGFDSLFTDAYADADMCVRGAKALNCMSVVVPAAFAVEGGFREQEAMHGGLYCGEMFAQRYGEKLRPLDELESECWASMASYAGLRAMDFPLPEHYRAL